MPSRKHTTQLVFSFTEAEIWRPVLGYEDCYSVSNHGRVKGIARLARHWRGGWSNIPERFLTISQISNGISLARAYVKLSKDGVKDSRPVHQLVLEAFVGPRPQGWACNHKNGNPLDNRLENLEWCTYAYNNQHALDTGLRKTFGEDNCNAKLTREQVQEIRQLHAEGMTYKALALLYGVDYTNIASIVTRKTWKHIR